MNQIFVTCAQNDIECVKQICNGLKMNGYSIWRDTLDVIQTSQVSRQEAEIGILGSIGVIAEWSPSAAQSEVLRQNLIFAQRLKKPILLVVLNQTELPKDLTHASFIQSTPPCTGIVRLLLQHLPSSGSPNPLDRLSLNRLYERAAAECERKSVSKKTIEDAKKLLTGMYREESLALVEYIAQIDVRGGIKDETQTMLKNELSSVEEPNYYFVATCPKNVKHHTTFDKRVVCAADSTVFAEHDVFQNNAESEIDSLILNCGICGAQMVVHIPCKGYQ